MHAPSAGWRTNKGHARLRGASGGAIALFWNRDTPSATAVTDDLRAAHALHAPEAWREPEPATDADRLWSEMSDFPLYTDFTAKIYRPLIP